MTWRKRNGWKATNQNLVIRLELAGYSPEEYNSILPLQENGRKNIYSKIDKTVSKFQQTYGYFRYDNHADTLEAKKVINRSFFVVFKIKSNLHYTSGIMPQRVASGGVNLRG